MQDLKSEIKLFLIVASVSAVLAVAGILLLKTIQPAPPAAGPTPRDQAELDFAGWQTYRNKEYGFEVEFPSTFFPQVPIYVVDDRESLQGYLDELESLRSSAIGGGPSVSVLEKRDIMIAERPAVQQEIYLTLGGIYRIETFIEITPGVIVSIFSTGGETEIGQSWRQLHNQILATFRFVEER